MNNNLTLAGQASVQVIKSPVVCSQCKQLRTQFERCENCGSEKPYSEETKHENR
jgi:hypothetical protein